MRIRIDFKILIFLVLFYLTNQIEIYILVMFFSIIHELGHIIMGLILKMKIEMLDIMPCGLCVSFKVNDNDLYNKIDNKNILILKKTIIAFAGPFVSICLIILYSNMEISLKNQNVIYSNMLITIFNLIPIYPLDGGRIIKGILHIKFGSTQSIYLTNKISNITMIILTIISSIAIYYFKNISIFLICLFLWGLILKENKKIKENS